MTQKGQITIPSSLRKALGLRPGDTVLIALELDGKLGVERLPSFDEMLASLPLVRIGDQTQAVDFDELALEALGGQAVAYRTRPQKDQTA